MLTSARQPVLNVTNLAGPLAVSFIAIKVGDVNGSWTSALAPQARTAAQAGAAVNSPTVSLMVSSETAPFVGAPVKVRVAVRGFTNVTSLQFSLGWNAAALEFLNVGDYGLNGLSVGNFGLGQISAGRLAFSWEDPNGVGLSIPDGTEVFSLEFRVTSSSGATVSATDAPTVREATVSGAVCRSTPRPVGWT